ncbi:hypothetical protein ABBQ32_012493 [Trebouxia sp. C0010 RCD-2024]
MDSDKQPVHRLNVLYNAQHRVSLHECLYATYLQSKDTCILIGPQEYNETRQFLRADSNKGSKDQLGDSKWRHKVRTANKLLLGAEGQEGMYKQVQVTDNQPSQHFVAVADSRDSKVFHDTLGGHSNACN